MKRAIFILVTLSTILNLNAQDADTLMLKANELFVAGNYPDAANTYEDILKKGFESPDLYYNLGNAYYKQNIISRAILNYEKALLLAPNDEDILYNLEITNRLVVDKMEKLPVFFITGWFKSISNLFSSDFWAMISVASFLLTLLFVSFFLYSKSSGFKKLSFLLGLIVVISSLSSFVFAYKQKQNIISGKTAIIMSPSVTLKSSPDHSGTDLFVLHEGTKVWIDDQVGDWNEIKMSDGSKGWLKAEDIEAI